MKKFLLGRKIGMTQIFDEAGEVVPVTVIETGPCKIVKVNTSEKEGYSAVCIGYGEKKKANCIKPELAFFEKANLDPVKVLKEFRVAPNDAHKVGDELTVTQFQPNEKVAVRGKTIGKGFTGTIKRWNFSRGPMTHGSKSHRIPGSIGAGTTPGRVLKGKKMAGHYGDEFVKMRNLKVVRIDAEKNLAYET